MRVIAGDYRGARLKAVAGNRVRPTTDRVKESLFQVIGPFFTGGRVLDLFAGTGALGIEALSRGCTEAIFVDVARTSLDVVRKNLEVVRAPEQKVIRGDARMVLRKLGKEQKGFDLIFMDPPYGDDVALELLELVSVAQLLTTEGMIVLEQPTVRQMPAELGELERVRILSYGDTTIHLYERKRDKGE
ncbi:16S rRNA (guanine(966)-N(2))-methyltransferase RsmD [Mechercharimyces sp. CAU 1602]|uniref:16S rRNA (guanine(966)-N(2))-methyltransferase RsmD n=1 Tax=Mechercharimyces sp. CAU 1602 TaxID=2973933 RepID=UPI002162D862|nr:16S rRNA (guanine(966)-N(2))-methyltransferase RsmD [Mechercharimyces sp. CAU 1602]MCS1351375.1 16S rRNA (guanine(966)-N(2))-methyltransferase RsmD [Mechercharimyces sp. CAU 1602]